MGRVRRDSLMIYSKCYTPSSRDKLPAIIGRTTMSVRRVVAALVSSAGRSSINSRSPPLIRQRCHRLSRRFDGDDADFRPIVEIRHHLKPNILLRIRHNPHDHCHGFRIDHIHKLLNKRRTRSRHRLQPTQIRQQPKPRLHQSQRCLKIRSDLFNFFRHHIPTINNRQQVPRWLSFDLNHIIMARASRPLN